LGRGLQIAVDGSVFLIEIGQVEKRVVLNLITIVPAAPGDVWVVMEIAVAVVSVITRNVPLSYSEPNSPALS